MFISGEEDCQFAKMIWNTQKIPLVYTSLEQAFLGLQRGWIFQERDRMGRLFWFCGQSSCIRIRSPLKGWMASTDGIVYDVEGFVLCWFRRVKWLELEGSRWSLPYFFLTLESYKDIRLMTDLS